MFLHNRASAPDFIQILKEHRSQFSTGVVHSFDGTWEEAQCMIADLDLYIGINGCSLRTPESLQVVKNLPLDRIMIETDAPWCDLRPTHASYEFLKDCPLSLPDQLKKERFVLGNRVKSRNEPCTLGHVLHVIAKIKELDPLDVASQIYDNSMQVFWPRNETLALL